MNEVIVPRNVIQKLKAREQAQFFNEINCAIMCTWSHKEFGHSSDFRKWWVQFQEQRGYKPSDWVSHLPLKQKEGLLR